MLRPVLSGAIALLIVAGGAYAAEVKGKVKSVDAAKSTITVTVDEKDTSYDVAKDAKVVRTLGKGKKATTETVSDGLKGVTTGSEVTLKTEVKDDKEVVTHVKIEGGKKKKNK